MKNKVSIVKLCVTLVICLALIPPAFAENAYGTVSRRDIVTTAARSGEFDTFVTAIRAAGLESYLKQPHSFTVFAPTDEAFAKLPPGVLDDLLKPENKETLVNILTYHVVFERRIISPALLRRPLIKTIQGSMIHAFRVQDNILVNNAVIVYPDITTKNGIIHGIDTVLIPE